MILSTNADIASNALVRGFIADADRDSLARRLLDAVPQVYVLQDQIDRLVAAVAPLQPVALDELTQGVRAMLAAGDQLPDDLVERYVSATNGVVGFNTARNYLSSLMTDLVAKQEHALRSGLDVMLAIIKDELSQTLKQIASAARSLHGVRSAAAAISAGVVKEWQAYEAAHERYSHIRTTQREACRKLMAQEQWDVVKRDWDLVSAAQGLPEVFPDMPDWLVHGTKLETNGRETRLTQPWPEDPHSREFADWLAVTPGALPWVPTPNQAGQLIHAIRRAARSRTRETTLSHFNRDDNSVYFAKLRIGAA